MFTASSNQAGNADNTNQAECKQHEQGELTAKTSTVNGVFSKEEKKDKPKDEAEAKKTTIMLTSSKENKPSGMLLTVVN